jgi:hypothetical protein
MMYYKAIMSKVKVASAVLALFLAGCDKEEKSVALSSIEVTPSQVNLTAGETQQLTATAVPADAEGYAAFVWSSTNDAVATVSDAGLVTAVAAGNATVKVTSGKIEKSVQVTVAITPSLSVTPLVPEQTPAAGGVLEFAIDANAAWTYNLSAGAQVWLTEATKTTLALTLTVSPNTDAETRNATLTFSLVDYSDVTQAVTVSQAAETTNVEDTEDFGPGVTPAVLTATAADLKTILEGITTAGNYVVNVTGNVTLNSAAENGNNIVLSTPGVTISLRGEGSNTITPANDACILRITEGKLILRNITLSKTGNKMPSVYITANGTLEINNGVSITGSGENTNAGVDVNGGHFLMKGGEIRGHRRPGGGGGGIFLHASGVFQMDGGKIYDNTAGYGGGIFISNANSSFIMNGGEFYDNHSTDGGEGGGAVYIWQNGHVEIHPDAIIYGNTGNGGSKAGNTATAGDIYGHALTAFYSASSGKYRSSTIQGETLSITLLSGGETESSGTWNSFP